MAALPNCSTLSVEEYLRLDRGSSEARSDACYEYIDGHVRMLAGGQLITPKSVLMSLESSMDCWKVARVASILLMYGSVFPGNVMSILMCQ